MTHGTPIRARFINHSQGLAHWIGRKFGNHAPMRDTVATSLRRKGAAVSFLAGTNQKTVVYALPDGRRYTISVEELPADVAIQTEAFNHA